HTLLAQSYVDDYKALLLSLRRQLFGPLEDAQLALLHPSRALLQHLTRELHYLSESLDTFLTRFEYGLSTLGDLRAAHARMVTLLRDEKGEREDEQATGKTAGLSKGCTQQQADALHYLAVRMDALRRKLETCRLARNKAMTLVMRLVTQLDAATTVAIAQAARADSVVMRTIAVLT